MRIAILFIFALAAFAQPATRTVTLTWADTANPAGTTYLVYRAPGTCSPTSTFVKITATPITAKTYQDPGLAIGTKHCYVVTAFVTTLESGYSNQAAADVRPFDPSDLNVTVQ